MNSHGRTLLSAGEALEQSLTTSAFGWPLVCVALQLVLSVVMALLSDGSYHDDGLTHYLYARWAWALPAYLVDEWGRPGVTCLLFPFGLWGWTAGRIVMALASAVASWLAFRSAVRMGMAKAGWVPWLCLVQPVFLLASYTTFTETAAALYLTVAVWAFLNGWHRWAAAVFSLCFVTRYEMLALLPIWAWAIRCARGHWLAYGLLLWAPLAHNLLGVLAMGRWPIGFIVSGSHPDIYGSGTPLTMLVKSMAAYGPAVAVLAVVGAVCFRRSARADQPAATWIVPAIFGSYLLLHSLIFWLGEFASGGYPRFLVTTSPLAAICAAGGIAALSGADRSQWWSTCGGWLVMAVVVGLLWFGLEREAAIHDEAWMFLIPEVRLAIRGVATATLVLILATLVMRSSRTGSDAGNTPLGWTCATLVGLAVVATAAPLAYLIRPHRLNADERQMQEAMEWLTQSPYAGRQVITTNIWVCHLLNSDRNLIPPDSTTILDEAAAETIFVWDADYSPTPRFGISRESMENRPGWQLLWPDGGRIPPEQFVAIYLRK